MAKYLNLKLAGLWTAPNTYSGVPEGALKVADNIVIDQRNLAESRKGFKLYLDGEGAGLTSYKCQNLINVSQDFEDTLSYWKANDGLSGKLLLNTSQPSGSSSFLPPSNATRTRFLPWGEYVYATSNDGIKRYSAVLDTVDQAGVPQALDLVLALTGSSGFLTANEVASITALVTDSSPTLSVISDADVNNFFIGQYITGNGIVDGTTVVDVQLSTPVVIHAANLAGGTDTIVVSSLSGVAVNQLVLGQGIPTDTRVLATSGSGPTYNIQLSKSVIETATAASITFSSDNTVTMSQNASIVGGPSTETLALSNGSQIAYRLIWCFRNENEAISVGAPSSFTTIANNTGASRDVTAVATIPQGITADYFYQLYRSVATPAISITPADQMQLVVEGYPSPTDIANGYVTILDQTPDSLKGEALYSGSDVEGISQSNYRPPTAADFCSFRGYTLYSNYKTIPQLKLVIDGVGSPNGVQINDEITISDGTNTFILTASAAENAATGEFEVFSVGTPAQNIADTAASFIRVLNRYSANTLCYAYLISGPGDLPGQMLLEAREGVQPFTVEADLHGDAWTPNIDTPQTAEIESVRNGVLVSKIQQPEAVPRINLFRAGGFNTEIIRMIPLREYVVVLANDGIYRLTGTNIRDFVIEPFDLTTRIVAPDTAVALGNECWCLANQGVVSISDAGVKSRSTLEIDDVIRALFGQASAAVYETAFAVAYETDHRYILSLPDSDGDTFTVQQYCFNYITNAWTRWTRQSTAGFIRGDNRLVLANGNNSNVVEERKMDDFTDYVDEAIPVTIVSHDGFDVVVDSVAGISVGDILRQDSPQVLYAEVLAIDFPANTVTLNQSLDWDPGSANFLTAIQCAIEWNPVSAGDPTEAKQHSEGQIVFRRPRFSTATLRFATDMSPGFEDVEIEGQSSGGWGLFLWGLVPWGGISRSLSKRFYVPANKQYAGTVIVRLQLRSGYSNWALEGASIALFDIGFELGGKAG